MRDNGIKLQVTPHEAALAHAEGWSYLPQAQTCFNKLLLPPYRTLTVLRAKFFEAMQQRTFEQA
jgi:HECT-domain (ubiquitin-transferase)